MRHILDNTATIVAPATATGGAVMMIRISGADAIAIVDGMFRGREPLSDAKGYTLHYGHIMDGDRVIDDVVIALFRAPHSYTGEDVVEITTHGSEYITSEVLRLAIERGARMATAGEFTQRAFLAGKMDLSRAEAVADIIASDSRWSHDVAQRQMRGGYSAHLATLREGLLRLCTLLELELDFSEEDVEFADRTQLRTMINEIKQDIEQLISSFALGNALKEGVSVAIIGEPNVGKSTLLNALVEDDRAMVSDIAGTTRDTIEATTTIDGLRFRFVDTAGLRTTDDHLERMGIERTHRAIERANIILHIVSADYPYFADVNIEAEQRYIRVVNKVDDIGIVNSNTTDSTPLHISAKYGYGIEQLRTILRHSVDTSQLMSGSIVVSNMRHYDALRNAYDALCDAERAMGNQLSGDLLSEDLRRVLHHIGEITGEITSDDILHSIFSKFCIGK